ncbi:MAG TPA: acyl-CoA reductase, partial [Polyangiales bacterium]|nr:acyl-CoA reductase [Polyangiales bacterium]
WLATAFAHIARADSELGREAVQVLAASSGLSEPMVRWAIDTTLGPLTFEALHALERAPTLAGCVRARPGKLCAVVLAGNVVTGAARAIGYPLLFGWPVLAKASSGDDALARLMEAALAESDPELADAYRVVTYASQHEALTTLLLQQADAVIAYGSDQSVNTIRAQAGATASFVGHGHGLGVAFVGREADYEAAAHALALDVAAYDQRGCLSPHVAWVERDGADFASLVQRELAQLAVTLPRGRMPYDLAGAQLSWRGVGAMRGQLFEGDGYAVSFEQEGPIRVSPGYRNLQVLAVDDASALPARLSPLGVHLKTIGVAGVRDVTTFARSLPAGVAPRICELGEMQIPQPEALHDALPPWEGLLRWIQV